MPGQWKPPTQPVDSGWKPPTASIDVENKPASKKGGLISTLSNAWDSLNTPAVRLMSPETRSMSDDYGNPTKDDSVWKARAKGFLSGAMGGIDDLVSSQSAPMNIGLEAVGLGGTAASARAAKLAKGAKDLNKAKQFEQIANTANKIKQSAGAGMAAHGIYKGAEGENIGERMGGVLEALGGAGLMFSGKPLKVNKPTNNGPKLLKAGQYEAGPSELGTVPGLLKKGEQPEVVINNKGQREVRNRFDGSYAPQPEPIGRVPEENPNLQGQFSRLPEDHPDYVNPELQGQTSRIPEDRPGYVAPEFQPVEEPVTQPVQEPPRTAGPNNGMPSIDELPESWKPFAGEDPRVTSLEPDPWANDLSHQSPTALDEGLPIEQEMSQIDDVEARRQQMKDALKGKTRATARMGSLSFDRPGTFSSDNLSSSLPQELGAVSDPTGNSIPQAEPEVMGMPKNMGEIGTPEGAMPSVGEVEGSPAAGSNSEVVPPLRAKDALKLLKDKASKLVTDESGSAPPLDTYQAQEAQKLRTFGQKFKDQLKLDNNNPLTTVGNLSRSLMSSLDLSPLRQAAPLMGKAEYWKNIGPMIRMFGDEDFYNKTMNEIKSGPNYKYKVQNGLQLTDINGMREEQFLSNLAEEVPFLGRLVKSSNRAFTGYLDLLRDKVSDDLLAQATQQGRMKPQGTMDLFGNVNETFGNDKLAKEIMNFVNTATGRGSLGRFEQSAKVLNATLFSPRLMVSRINMLRPDKYITADPFVRKEMLKSMGTFFGAAVGMNLLASMVPGVSTSFDPTSSDFMKIKIGNTRIDIGGGFQQYLVLMARTVPEMAQTLGIGSGGKTTSSSTGKVTNLGQGYGSPDGSDILYNFMESKEAPMISFAMGLLKGKDFEGKPFNAPRELVDRFMPMIIGDMRDILNDDPKALLFLIPAVFGAGVQTYPPKKRGMSMGGLSMGNMKLQ